MRALLLCSLGAVLLWFAWHSLGGSSVNAGEEIASPGTMLPPEKRGETPSPAPTVATPPPAAVGTPKPPEIPAPKTDAGPTASVSAAAADEKPPAPLASAIVVVPEKLEIELARALVSNPGGFCGEVERHTEMPAARRKFALALGKVFEGQRDEARGLANGIAEDALVRTSERAFLDRLLGGPVTTAQAAAATTESPLVWAALLVSQSREGESAESAGRFADAARAYSSVLLDYVRAPWKSDPEVLRRWSGALTKNQQKHRWSRTGDWPSIAVPVANGDSLIGLRKRVIKENPELQICTGQIERANELRGGILHPGQTLRIPTDRARMLVDLDAHWAFYVIGGEVAAAFEVGVGKDGGTKPGRYVVGDKKEEPMWFRPGHEPVPYGSPENPLGTRWIAWTTESGQTTGLGFHGTNQPESIGKDESQGCIRMRNEDVEVLFEILPKGAAIEVQA